MLFQMMLAMMLVTTSFRVRQSRKMMPLKTMPKNDFYLFQFPKKKQ